MKHSSNNKLITVTFLIILIHLLNAQLVKPNYKSPGDICYRDEECLSGCCHAQLCMFSSNECAKQRIELLTKITEQIEKDPQLHQKILESTQQYYAELQSKEEDQQSNQSRDDRNVVGQQSLVNDLQVDHNTIENLYDILQDQQGSLISIQNYHSVKEVNELNKETETNLTFNKKVTSLENKDEFIQVYPSNKNKVFILTQSSGLLLTIGLIIYLVAKRYSRNNNKKQQRGSAESIQDDQYTRLL